MKYNRPSHMEVTVRLINSFFSYYDDIKITIGIRGKLFANVVTSWDKLMTWPL